MSPLDDNINFLDLVKKAQFGCQESMDRLAHLVQRSLFAYIYRLTLNHDVTEDLRQETMLEMVNSLKRLKFEHFDQFWAWLYRTAFGKVQHHFRNLRHERIAQKMSTLDKEKLLQRVSGSYGDGLKSLISKELSEAVIEAMGKLKLRHRNILVLRCCEQMPYSKIAAVMDCSELAAQVLFFRAKHSLKRQLSKHGFGKGMLLAALGLFGKITTPADAAPVTVSAASTKVGVAATVIGAVGTKLGITIGTAITTIALTVCGITTISDNNTSVSYDTGTNISSSLAPGNEMFEYPYQLLVANDPDGDGWNGLKVNGVHLVPVVPEKCLVGSPPSEHSAVVLPIDHWVELKFRGRIIDGPGYDIVLIERDENGEQAHVFITDGAGNKYLLGVAMVGTSGQPSHTEIGFDISDISLPFVPCAVRILGTKEGGETHGFDLHSVQARIYVSRDDY